MENFKKERKFDEDFLWIFHKIEYPAICLSLDYRIVDLTSATEALFVTSRKKILYQSVQSLFKQVGLEITLLENKKNHSITVFSNNTNHSQYTQQILNLNWKIRPKNTTAGEIVGFILYSEKQYTTTEELYIKEVKDEATKFIQKLAGSITHAIRTPLAIIGINTNLLERNRCLATTNEADKNAEKYIKTIKYAIKLTSCIIDDTLVMIRTLFTKQPPNDEFQHLSIMESIQNALETYPFLNQEQTQVNLLNTSNDFIYYGDKILTQHILFNLIKNALCSIKEAGKGSITIELKTGIINNSLILTDTGLGISQHSIPKIFEQFENKKDTGLGLAFCKTVMQFYGGSIRCTSELGKYATFTLNFPAITKA